MQHSSCMWPQIYLVFAAVQLTPMTMMQRQTGTSSIIPRHVAMKSKIIHDRWLTAFSAARRSFVILIGVAVRVDDDETPLPTGGRLWPLTCHSPEPEIDRPRPTDADELPTDLGGLNMTTWRAASRSQPSASTAISQHRTAQPSRLQMWFVPVNTPMGLLRQRVEFSWLWTITERSLQW